MSGMIEVVIPAYNAAPFLRETLEGFAAQTRPPSRVTVVNDRSTDGTDSLARALAPELAPRFALRVLDNAGPRGISGARNTAIRASEAPFIALCDADDVPRPRYIDALAGLLSLAPDLVLAFGDTEEFAHPSGETLPPSFNQKQGLYDLPSEPVGEGFAIGEAMFGAVLETGRFCASANMFRRADGLEAGLFDETITYCEDIEFFARLCLRGRFAGTREIILRKRVHAQNHSRPANAVRMIAGQARGCVGLAKRAKPDAAERLRLTSAQQDALDAWIPRVINQYIYWASRDGFAAYREAARLAASAGELRFAASPRHLARLIAYRVLPRLRMPKR